MILFCPHFPPPLRLVHFFNAQARKRKSDEKRKRDLLLIRKMQLKQCKFELHSIISAKCKNRSNLTFWDRTRAGTCQEKRFGKAGILGTRFFFSLKIIRFLLKSFILRDSKVFQMFKQLKGLNGHRLNMRLAWSATSETQ